MTVRLGTRGSLLARTQASTVAAALEAATGVACELVAIRSEGDDHSVPLDAPNRPGAFVATLRDALLEGRVDLVVHSFKDLPSTPQPGLVVAAIPERAPAHDVLVSADGAGLGGLRPGASVGTSSPRRSAALLRARPDLRIVPVRGNVDTRLGLVDSGRVDAVVLAAAGLQRVGRLTDAMASLGSEVMVPAPAQGALAVECRSGHDLETALAALDHAATRCAVTAERAVLAGVAATCTTAVGAYATWSGKVLELVAELSAHRGIGYSRRYAATTLTDPRDEEAARDLGLAVAEALLDEEVI